MFKPIQKKALIVIVFLMSSGLLTQNSLADESSTPGTTGMITFFYYDNHAEAVDFYTNKLGLKVVMDDGWIVIVETAPGSRIALADPSEGFLKPVKDKGALIAIETEELEAWYEKLKVQGMEFLFGWEDGDYVQQFRVYDPGGYVVEFVR
jgi:catechol 2,3-dioxygenase-like lactoylglutathione lyase family enzyme